MCVYCEKPRCEMHMQADRRLHNHGSMFIKETVRGMFRIVAVSIDGEPTYMESERISYCPFCGRLMRGEAHE